MPARMLCRIKLIGINLINYFIEQIAIASKKKSFDGFKIEKIAK